MSVKQASTYGAVIPGSDFIISLLGRQPVEIEENCERFVASTKRKFLSGPNLDETKHVYFLREVHEGD